jgi:hypothetical protein
MFSGHLDSPLESLIMDPDDSIVVLTVTPTTTGTTTSGRSVTVSITDCLILPFPPVSCIWRFHLTATHSEQRVGRMAVW